MRKPRNYSKEYARRKRNGLAKGLDLPTLRGHAKAGTVPASQHRTGSTRTKPDPILEDAISAMRGGETLGAVAKRMRVSRERLSAYAKQYAGAKRLAGAWDFDDRRVRRIPVIATDSVTFDKIKVRGFEPAHLAGEHYYEAEAVKEDPSLLPAFIERWRGKTIVDLNGRVFEFSVDLNQLFRVTSAEEIDWARIYHLYMH